MQLDINYHLSNTCYMMNWFKLKSYNVSFSTKTTIFCSMWPIKCRLHIYGCLLCCSKAFYLFFFASPIVCRSVHFINRRLKERANVATDSKHRNTRHVVVFSNEPNSFSRYRENSWNWFAVILECGKLAKWIFSDVLFAIYWDKQ